MQRIFERIDYKKDNKIDKEELEHTLRKALHACMH
jgi:Ca2+-binding EF-hand superfamily protein